MRWAPDDLAVSETSANLPHLDHGHERVKQSDIRRLLTRMRTEMIIAPLRTASPQAVKRLPVLSLVRHHVNNDTFPNLHLSHSSLLVSPSTSDPCHCTADHCTVPNRSLIPSVIPFKLQFSCTCFLITIPSSTSSSPEHPLFDYAAHSAAILISAPHLLNGTLLLHRPPDCSTFPPDCC